MTLPKKRTLMIALLMATSFSQGGQGMEGDKTYRYQDNGWKLPRLTTALMYGAALLSNNAEASVTFGTEFQINRLSLSSSGGITMAGLPNGNVVAAWWNNGNVVGQIFDPNDGTVVKSEFNMTTVAPASQVLPSLAAVSDKWCATWTQNGTQVLLGFFYLNGTAIRNPLVVNPAPSTAQGAGSVTGLTGGRGLVSAVNFTGGTYSIVASTFNSDGSGLTLPIILEQGTRNIGASSSTSLSNGNGFIVWGSTVVNPPNYLIRGAQVTPSGTLFGNVININQVTNTALGVPSSAGLMNNDVMVVYTRGPFALLGSIIKNGVPGNELSVLNITAQVSSPNVASLVDGTALVAWDSVQGGIRNSVGRFFLDNLPLTGEVGIPTNAIGGATAAVRLGTGGAFVGWSDPNRFSNFFGRTVSFTPDSPTSSPTLSPTGTPNTMPTTANPTSIPTSVSPTGTPNVMPTTATPTNIPTSLSPTGAPNTIPTTVSPTRSPTRAPTTSSASRLTPGWWLPTKLVSQAFKAVVGLFQ
ncbi:MAG: hypothetical protein K0R52_540 [Alphaproteobacteria bacterium]|jgi:hypothetical protein|nr:hypothetical protein [Alphaproteobacteria bacterium]